MTAMCVEAANYLIRRTNEYNASHSFEEQIAMTCKRLQKLLYFSDIAYMQMSGGRTMFSDEFCAWPSGPVIPSVYRKFMRYQNGEMVPLTGEHIPITSKMQEALETVFSLTVNTDTYDLVELSHDENGPWKHVYNKNDEKHEQIICKEDIYNFYKDIDLNGLLTTI